MVVTSSKALASAARHMVKRTIRFVSTGHQQQKNPPEPLPNRPLRGERSSSSTNNHTQSDNTFLEQFKIGREQQNPTQIISKEEAEDSDEIFKKMKEGGLIPNAVAMLDGLCKDGLVHEAMKLFGLMREKGTIPDVVIYTAVVDGFCKAHKIEDAMRIFRKMQNNGISPNAFSYGVLVQGLYNCNLIDDALDFCLEMLDSGHSPNIPTFVGLVDAFCREKGVQQAQSAIHTLNQRGFHVNLKAVKEFMDKRAPFPSLASEAIFNKKPS